MRALGLLVGTLVLGGGCASVARVSSSDPEIVVDFERGTIRSPEWQTELIDCSDSQFQCVEAPGHFLLAFPRVCPTETWDWSIAGYRFRLTAPMPHYMLPTGGYFSEKYPHAHLIYREGLGFHALWVRANPVPTANWGGTSVAEYQIRYVGNATPFICR